MTTRQAVKWIKSIFSDDIAFEDGFEGYIRIMPLMDSEPCSLIYNYYTVEKKISVAKSGTSNRMYREISKFAALYSDVLDVGKGIEENINAMMEKSLDKSLCESAYLNLCLDRLKYPCFVDVRLIFNKLYLDFDPKETKKASEKFQEFVEEQDERKLLMESAGKEYIKEFFNADA
jgi:hypothetical protein